MKQFSPTTEKKYLIFLLVIISIGGIIRFWGLNFGFPNIWCRPDELTISNKAWHLAGDLNPRFFNYPSLFMYFLLLSYVAYFGFGFIFGMFNSLNQFRSYHYNNIPDFIFISRGISALLGTISIYLVYRLAKKCYSEEVGIISALFFSLTYLHVRDSHFGVTDVPLTFMIILAYIFIVNCFIKGDTKSYLLAGIVSGLATSTKYNAGLLIVPIFFAHFFFHRGNGRNFKQTIFAKKLWICYGVMIGAFMLGSPYVLLDIKKFLHDFLFEVNHLKAGHGIDLGIGWIYHLKFSLRYGMGLPYLIAALCGTSFVIYRHRAVDITLLCFPLVYYLFIGKGTTVFVRYIIPVLPFLSIFSAVFLTNIIRNTTIPRKILVGASSILLLIPSIYNIVNYNLLLSKPDTRVSAQKWIETHIPQNSRILFNSSKRGLPFIDGELYQLYCLNCDEKPYANSDADYAIIADSFLPLYTKLSKQTLDFLKKNQFELIKEFNPFNDKINDNKPIYDQIDDFYIPYSNYKGVKLPGPFIRIYKLGTRE